MTRSSVVLSVACVASGLAAMLAFAGDGPAAPTPTPAAAAAADADGVAEARLRSRLLHETIHGSLQVMHRDFFRDEGRVPIPSKSLEDVFAELERTWRVKVRWLAVDAKPMTAGHRPDGPFDERAVQAISGGGEMFEAAEGGVYQYAGKITLGGTCLGCHAPGRTGAGDRKAAVVISMPLDLRELTGPAAEGAGARDIAK